MSVSRIQELDIDSRPLVTGIYGLSAANEFYVDKDLCRYHLWQELYLYLHEKGYITVFYNIAENLFSYQERDLELFFRRAEVNDERHHQESRPQTSSSRRHPRCRGPLGFAHPYNPTNSPASSGASDSNSSRPIPSVQPSEGSRIATELQSHHPDIMVGGDRTKGNFFQTKRGLPDLFNQCFRYADDYPNRKLAVVFTTPESSEIDPRQYATVIAKLKPLVLGRSKANLPLRFLILYSEANANALYSKFGGPQFFYHLYFKDLYFPQTQDEQHIRIDHTTLFRIGRPGMDEIGNVLNKRRLEENGLSGLFNIPFDIVCRNLWQNYPLKDEKGKNLIDPNTKSERTIESVEGFMQLPKEVLESTLLEMGKMEDFSMELLSRALSRVHGQQDSMKIIVRKVCTWIRRPDEKKVPLVLMLAGTSGTGKTFTVETVSDTLRSYGYLFVKLPMNEYKSAGDTWKLLGSAAGYVGSEEDAPLFAARKKSERLVILFDEIEKAHESIFETIMTLMEKGELTNGKGESFDFKQSIIFFTTNLAMNELLERKKELILSGNKLDSYTFQQSVKDILRNNHVKAEVCGRINTVLIYNTLTKETVARIAIDEIRGLGKIYNLNINNIAKSLLLEVINQAADSKEGARPIKELVRDKFEPIFQQ